MGPARRAYIALGSNLGNRRAYLREAVQNLPNVTKVSRLYETDPVGYDDQGAFLNLVVELETDLTPRQLLEICQQGEASALRERSVLNGPRTLDLDLLWVEGEEVNDMDLIVPHPRMFERGFVMIPLNDVNQEIPASWMAENMKGEKADFPGVRPAGELTLESPQPLEVITDIENLHQTAISIREQNKTIGLVPTMGALHQGHIALIEKSQAENDVTIVTIFVNPTQFNDPQDFQNYPTPDERDTELLQELCPDFIFKPKQEEVFPSDPQVNISLTPLTSELEGAHRPGHLEGVCLIVLKLLNMVGRCSAYFGEKDYQQFMVVKQMVEDLNVPANIVGCPTVRDYDGLALSSRNVLLKPTEREAALLLHKGLEAGRLLVADGETKSAKIIKQIKKTAASHPRIKLEYVAIREPLTFQDVKKIKGSVRILVAAKVGDIRLIDNVPAEPKSLINGKANENS